MFVPSDPSDIGTELNAYMAALADGASQGGIVSMDAGDFYTSVPLFIPQQVKLRGCGKRTTLIHANGSFPTSTPVVTLGRVSDGIVFDCGIEDLSIDCAQVAGSIGVYSNLANEGCGLQRTIVKHYKDTGVFYDANCEHFQNTDLEVIATNQTNNYGIKLVGGAGWPGNGVHQVTFERLTVVGNGVGNSLGAVYLENASVFMSDVHLESCTDGFVIVGDHVYGVINTIDGLLMTNVVHFTGGVAPIVINGMSASYATTNLILDDATGAAISDPYAVGPWSRLAPVTVTPPTTVTVGYYALTPEDTVIIANCAFGSGLEFPEAIQNPGRVIHVKTIIDQVVSSVQNDIVPLEGGAAGSDILSALVGQWAIIKSDGTNWVIIASNAPSAGTGFIFTSVPGATYTLADNVSGLSATGTGLELTLPAAADFPGRMVWIRTVYDYPVDSASSNIGTLNGGLGAEILPATGGAWVVLQSDGASYWQIVASSHNSTFWGVTDATYTLAGNVSGVSARGTGLTITLGDAALCPGRQVWIRNTVAYAVDSASSNIIGLDEGLSSSILPATVGTWVMLQAGGAISAYWHVMSKGDDSAW